MPICVLPAITSELTLTEAQAIGHCHIFFVSFTKMHLSESRLAAEICQCLEGRVCVSITKSQTSWSHLHTYFVPYQSTWKRSWAMVLPVFEIEFLETKLIGFKISNLQSAKF